MDIKHVRVGHTVKFISGMTAKILEINGRRIIYDLFHENGMLSSKKHSWDYNNFITEGTPKWIVNNIQRSGLLKLL